MPLVRRGRLGLIALAAGCVGTAMCVSDFDTQRQVPATRGTVGAEVFHIVCERVDVGESPDDLDFERARGACDGIPADGGMPMAVGPKVRTMAERRSGIVDAIDRAVPRALYDDADGMLFNLLPLYGPDNGHTGGTIRLADGGTIPGDEDLLPQTTRALSRVLNTIVNDASAPAAFAALSHHQGYRPARIALGLTRALLGYPHLGDVLESTFSLVRDGDITHPPGVARDHFHALLDMASGELARSAPATAADARSGTTLDAVADLVLRTDPSLATGHPRLVVRRDPFGMARIDQSSGSLPSPFVDVMPMDGFADSHEGQYLDARGRPLNVLTPFQANDAPDGMRDAQGRAISSGLTVYDYVDLDASVLGALLHDARSLVEPANSIALRFAHGASALLGARAPATRDFMLVRACPNASDPNATCTVPPVQYSSFDSSRNAPLADFVHAVGLLLTHPDGDRILAAAQSLMTDHEPEMARALGAMLSINDSANSHPESTIDPRSNIWDDIMDCARQIAQEPGLFEDIITAAQDPATAQLGTAFAAFARNIDRVQPTWTAAAQNTTLAGQTLSHPVLRGAPDTVDATWNTTTGALSAGSPDNRSVFERFLHLIYDLDGVEICNKEGAQIRARVLGITVTYPSTFRRCELIRIPNAAVFYLQTIAGVGRINLMAGGLLGWVAGIPGFSGTMDSLIEAQSGITGFNTTPTSPAVNRFVFQPDGLRTPFTLALVDPVLTRDGRDVRTVHPGTLFALEMYNLYANIRPLVMAFVNHHQEALLVGLLSALHKHYPSDRAGQFQSTSTTSAFYNTMDGAVRYEPIIADAFAGDLLPATSALTRVLPSINVGGGQTGTQAIATVARALLDPHAITNIAYRDGRTSTMRSDGTTPVPAPNLYYLFADAMNGIDTAFTGHDTELMDWRAARSQLVDTFLAVNNAGSASARFQNRRIPAVSGLAVQWVRDRLQAHRNVGDADAWARGLSGRFADTVHGPAFGTGVDFFLDAYNDMHARNAVGALLTYLLDDSNPTSDNIFAATLTALADSLQVLRDDTDIDPVLHALAPAFQRAQTAASGGAIREELVPVVLRMLDRTRQYDAPHVLDRLLENLVSRPASPVLADEPLVVMGDAIAETHRTIPGHGGALDAADVREVFRQTSDFFTDGTRGMEQFYFVVQHRRF